MKMGRIAKHTAFVALLQLLIYSLHQGLLSAFLEFLIDVVTVILSVPALEGIHLMNEFMDFEIISSNCLKLMSSFCKESRYISESHPLSVIKLYYKQVACRKRGSTQSRTWNVNQKCKISQLLLFEMFSYPQNIL